MSEPLTPRKEINFNNTDEIFKIHMIGYHDFRVIDTWRFFRALPWNALHYVRNGRGKLFVRGREYTLEAGDIFFIERNESVMYHADENDPWRYYWVDFYGDAQFMVGEKLGLDSDSPVLRAEHADKVADIFDELLSLNVSQTALYYSTLSVIMQLISLEHNKNAALKNESQKGSLIENAKKVIELNYTRFDFSVKDISKMLYVSERHIRRVFRESTGMTPVAYISDFRLNAALNLLQQHSYTVDELCFAVGWSDKLYFMNCFKKKYHMTVKEFRSRNFAL